MNEAKRFKNTLPCKLTSSEINEKAKLLVKKSREMHALELQKKSSADEFKTKIEMIEIEINDLESMVDQEIEYRDVDCVEEMDFDAGIVCLHRVDTWEVIKSREMTTEERQQILPFQSKQNEEIEMHEVKAPPRRRVVTAKDKHFEEEA